ncbi:CDP-glycerol:glycerophosphate glycerophosphotransferase, partial [Actinospica acidiphila]|nr:CDP-glycerol:glycerophosphate glycerophosphotransferase [Actinospica acidiphila]
PAALESAVRDHAPRVRTAWATRRELHHTLPTATRRLVPGTAAHLTALARSAYVVTDRALVPGLVKRKGQILVHTPPGTPLAYAGLDLQDRPAAARDTDFARLLEGVDQWDHVVTGDRHSTLTYERVLPGRYRTLEYGRPRTDRFHTATPQDVAVLRDCLGVPAGAVAILYAPAPRDYRRTPVRTLDLERVVRRLGPRFVILSRAAGPDGEPLEAVSDRVVDVSAHPDVMALCLASDALVTDFSPLMCDYAGLDRPIVLHAEDREAYAAARGLYVDPWTVPPGAVADSEDELIEIFAGSRWCGPRATRLRAAFRDRFCPHDDGRAAERVVRTVLLGEFAEPLSVPPARRRPVPAAAVA